MINCEKEKKYAGAEALDSVDEIDRSVALLFLDLIQLGGRRIIYGLPSSNTGLG